MLYARGRREGVLRLYQRGGNRKPLVKPCVRERHDIIGLCGAGATAEAKALLTANQGQI